MRLDHPLAITMWDFSWLERRWPGAGYADWERALDELVVRGYDAVRIDAYPHLYAAGPQREHTILLQVLGGLSQGLPLLFPHLVAPPQ